MNMTIP